MRLKLTKLRHTVTGPMHSKLFEGSWYIGEERDLTEETAVTLLDMYPKYFTKVAVVVKEVEKPAEETAMPKMMRPKKDKLLRKTPDKGL